VRLAPLVVLIGLLAGGALVYWPYTWTPDPLPADASPTSFSADRALEDLRAVAAAPRPMGSAAHEAAIDEIQRRLTDLGIEHAVVEDTVARPDFGQVFAGRLRNVIARIPGTDSTGAVLLLSHFNSVPTSYNASDGGLGVATVLETVRAIQAGPPLRNDLVLWFGDADETTAMSARILQEHPWFETVRFAYAFEAIGVRGPSILSYAGQGDPDPDDPVQSVGQNEELSLASNPHFSSRNGRWLHETLAAIPHPIVALPLADPALGIGAELGVAMWGTDVAGVSFAQIGDTAGYHTDLDHPARVSPSSLQHSGETSLALAQHFGALELEQVSPEGGRVAFTLLPGVVIQYPSALAVPLATVVSLLLAVALVLERRRGQLTIPSIVLGMMVHLIAVVIAVVAAVFVSGVLAPDVLFARGTYGDSWRLLLLGTVSLGSLVSVFWLATRRVGAARRAGLMAGPVVVLALLSLLTATTMPALSYVFLLPTLGGCGLVLWGAAGGRVRGGAGSWGYVAALVATGFLVLLVAVPLAYLLGGTLTPSQPTIAALIVIVTTLVGGALLPHVRFLGGRLTWRAPAVLLALAVAFVATEQLTSGFDVDRPRPNHIQYTLNADTGEATWLSAATHPDPWTDQFFEAGYSTGSKAFSPGYSFGQEFTVIETPAPAVALPAPTLTVLTDSFEDDVRTVRFAARSERDALMVHVDLALPGELVAVTVEDRALPVDEGAGLRRLPLALYNPGAAGIEVIVSVRSGEPIDAVLSDFTDGLPDIASMEVTERPPDAMPAPFDFRDPTVVTRYLQF
jgi:hypothetical protein